MIDIPIAVREAQLCEALSVRVRAMKLALDEGAARVCCKQVQDILHGVCGRSIGGHRDSLTYRPIAMCPPPCTTRLPA